MEYYNIKKDNSIILCKDSKFERSDLVERFKLEISKSNFIKINSIKYLGKSQFYIDLIYKETKIGLNCFIKNITGAGWETKPEFKRIQVSNLKKINGTSLNYDLNVAFGFYDFDENPLIVAWDIYRYLNHNTIRSCYVTTDSMILGYERKYYEGVVSSQKLWIFKGNKFSEFIESYITYINEYYKEKGNNEQHN